MNQAAPLTIKTTQLVHRQPIYWKTKPPTTTRSGSVCVLRWSREDLCKAAMSYSMTLAADATKAVHDIIGIAVAGMLSRGLH